MSDEIEYFNNKRPDRVYISKSINEPLQKAVFNSEGRLVEIEESNRCLRYLSRVFDSDDIHEFAKIKNEICFLNTNKKQLAKPTRFLSQHLFST